MKGFRTIRARFEMFTIVVVLVTVLVTVFLLENHMTRIESRASKEYVKFYTSELVGELEAQIGGEIPLILKLSHSENVINWMSNEQNLRYKDSVSVESQNLLPFLKNENIFFAIDGSKHFYFTDKIELDSKWAPQATLDINSASDAWYFNTVNTPEPYLLTVAQDHFTQRLHIWINVKVMDKDKVVGIIGTGLYLDPIIDAAFDQHLDKGTKSIVINEFGDIQLDTDRSNIRENNLFPSENQKQTIFRYSDNKRISSAIKDYLTSPDKMIVIRYQGKPRRYMALSPIEGTRWHVVTLLKDKGLFALSNDISLLWMMLLMILIFAFAVYFIAQKAFVGPFEKLKKSIEMRETSQEFTLFGLEREDEFGVLARTIQQMSERLVSSVPVGMFLMDLKGQLLYGNPYFLKQFEVVSKDVLVERIFNKPETIFASMTEFDKLKDLIKQQLDLYIYEIEFLNSSGEPFWTEVRLTKVSHKKFGWQYEGILINVQGKKNYETSLVTLANTDQLTGLSNRHYFDEIVIREIIRSDRYGEAISLIIFDLDHFKRVNDTWGHDIGDEVLVDTANISKLCLRESDTFARWGGEEFAVLMPSTDLAGAILVAEKIRLQLEKRLHPIVGQITASFGVSERNSNEIYSNWFKRTDQAMFAVKKKGRNDIATAVDEIPLSDSFVKLLWQESFNSGSSVIDNEHKRLFTLSNALMESALKSDNEERTLLILISIKEHLADHLEHEELILKGTDFPKHELERHHQIHQALIRRLDYLHSQFADKLIKGTELFIILINELIVDHMIKEDIHFFSYLS